MSDFRSLILAHKGKRVCVMGGADRLASDLASVEADVYISTNAHGVDIRKPDYLLAMDNIHGRLKVPMGTFLREKSDAPIISPHPYADILLGDWPQNPRFVLSGMIGAWCAYMMGAKVVILAGMDGYGGGDSGWLDEARKISREINCPVRVAGGGPLTKVWPAYDPGERFGRYKPSTAIDGWLGKDGAITIRVVKRCFIRGAERFPGDELTVYRHEVKHELKHKSVREV